MQQATTLPTSRTIFVTTSRLPVVVPHDDNWFSFVAHDVRVSPDCALLCAACAASCPLPWFTVSSGAVVDQLRDATTAYFVQGIRLVRDRETGDARFAFLEFGTTEESGNFLSQYGSAPTATPLVIDGRRVWAEFGVPRRNGQSSSFPAAADWTYVDNINPLPGTLAVSRWSCFELFLSINHTGIVE